VTADQGRPDGWASDGCGGKAINPADGLCCGGEEREGSVMAPVVSSGAVGGFQHQSPGW
jgi:hypothetical protein